MQSEKLDQLLPALSKARVNFGSIKKNKENPHFHSWYAPLEEILVAIEKPLAEQGLNLIGWLETKTDQVVTVRTRLVHVSEQYIESTLDLPYQMGQLQHLGREVTYARRYSINTMLELSADSDLDEQQGPTKPSGRDRTGMTTSLKPSAGRAGKISESTGSSSPEPQPVQPANVTDDRKEETASRGGGRLTDREVQDLIKFLVEVYRSEEVAREQVRRAMGIPAGQIPHNTRIQLTMTRAQHDQVKGEAEAFLKAEINGNDDDVPHFPQPEASESPQDDTAVSPAGQEASEQLDGTSGQPGGLQGEFVMRLEVEDLKTLARKVGVDEQGVDAEADVQDFLEEHPEGVPRDLYEIMKQKLTERLAIKLKAEKAKAKKG